jgi:PAS domain S-box-containing protein
MIKLNSIVDNILTSVKLSNSSSSMQRSNSNYCTSLIEAIQDPLFTIKSDFTISDMNKAALLTTEVSRELMLGSDFSSYFTEPDMATMCCQNIFLKGSISNYPLILKDGKLTDILLSGTVFSNSEGKVIGAVIVTRDITEQKEVEKELIEAKVFAELTTVIAEEAKIKAETAAVLSEESLKTKQQFLSNMSHEIRTPMNAIIGFTKVMLKTQLSDKQREYLDAIKLSGDTLIVLINDILDLAKIEAGKMTFEETPFKIYSSLFAMIHLFERKIEEKNIKLVKEFDKNLPNVIIGDPIRLHQIIINLLSNAVKFTSAGEIIVNVHLVKEDTESSTISFSVADTGIGIPEDKLNSIFDNFQQASDSTSRLYGGTGLGLAIVKQLIESQGGSISVKSKESVGSKFTFELTFKKSKYEILPNVEIVYLDSDIKNIQVLAVEDIVLNQLLMKTLLDDFGFEGDIAENGKIAIEKISNKYYDIILMDLQMPVMNGFEATDYIRNRLKSDIPIIALTADVTTVDLEKCMNVGMNGYIAKPVDEKLLYNKIVSLVRKPQVESNINFKKSKDIKTSKCINLDYLAHRTKSDPHLMIEIITLYLEQTPSLILTMKKSFSLEDWNGLNAAVHKIIPSFSIMGISSDIENLAKSIKQYTTLNQQKEIVHDLITKIELVCNQAYIELEHELEILKLSSHD